MVDISRKVTVEWLSPEMDGYLSPSKTQVLAQKRGRRTRRWGGCHAKPSSRHGMAVGIMNTLQLCIPIQGPVFIISSWTREGYPTPHFFLKFLAVSISWDRVLSSVVQPLISHPHHSK